jgi:hypothetical protein
MIVRRSGAIVQEEKSHGVVNAWIGVENDLDFVHIENVPSRLVKKPISSP